MLFQSKQSKKRSYQIIDKTRKTIIKKTQKKPTELRKKGFPALSVFMENYAKIKIRSQ